jgi:16S rRNA (cytosine967-C5)-methyltransferase
MLQDMRGGALLDAAFEQRNAALDPRDRRWLQELTYGMLRVRSRLDVVIASRVSLGFARLDADLADLLRLGAYQLLHMDSVPAYAAIAQTVELAKQRHGIGASKLVNAVLRRIDRERSSLETELAVLDGDPVDAMALRWSHPRWLVARWVARWGQAETATLLQMNNLEAPLCIRPFGIVREQLEAKLEAADVSVTATPWLADGLQIRSPVAITQLGAFQQGAFFVQDPAAALVARYAAVAPGSLVLDLCAAPGGKAFELSHTARLVVAADKSEARIQRLRENIQRLEAQNVLPLVADARSFAVAVADTVLLDAPCTGTGTFRRHPDARWRLRVSDLAVCASVQRTLLRAAADLVRPGGVLVYSTCSLEPEENDQQIEQFLKERADFSLAPPPTAAVPAEVIDAGRLRVLPQRHGVDGAFAARMIKAAS